MQSINSVLIPSFSPWLICTPPKEYLLGVIEVCYRFEMDQGVQWAIHYLERLMPPLSASQCLFLSARYQIEHWVRPAVRDLIERHKGARKLHLISDGNLDQMGAGAYAAVVKEVERVQEEHITLAFWPPEMQHSVVCRRGGDKATMKCSEKWCLIWDSKLPKSLLSFHRPLSLASLPEFLHSLDFDSEKVLKSCRDLTISRIESIGIS